MSNPTANTAFIGSVHRILQSESLPRPTPGDSAGSTTLPGGTYRALGEVVAARPIRKRAADRVQRWPKHPNSVTNPSVSRGGESATRQTLFVTPNTSSYSCLVRMIRPFSFRLLVPLAV
jgi:hypothetical protein